MVLAKKKPEKDLPEDCPTLRPRLRAKAIPKKKRFCYRGEGGDIFSASKDGNGANSVRLKLSGKKIKGKKD